MTTDAIGRRAAAWMAACVVVCGVALWVVSPAVAQTQDQVLARYQDGTLQVVLTTETCGPKRSKIQRAIRKVDNRESDGCWAVNEAGDPVVVWSDGQVQTLASDRVILTQRYANLLEDTDISPAPPAAARATTTSVAPSAGFPRPFWCKDAFHPHERLTCSDRELSAAALTLNPLWRSYRAEMRLSKVQEAQVKRDLLERLKDCGADKACVSREQSVQARLYRDALGQP